MTAIFRGRHGDRLVVETGEGFLVANAIGDCDLDVGEVVGGVSRSLGTQHWRGSRGGVLEVWVDNFDMDAATALGWLHSV